MKNAISLVVAVLLAVGCSKKEDKAAPPPNAPPPATQPVGADGLRRVSITASKDGYVPAEIPAKPNEKLMLVFTRTVEGECLAKVKTPDGKEVALPMNQPVEVPVTAPATGSVTFVCGMDMFKGTIIASGS